MSYRPYYPAPDSGRAPGFLAHLPPVCSWLIKINAGAFLFFWLLRPAGLYGLLALSLAGIRQGHLWQPLTYMFLHGGFTHLLFNMFTLYFLGPETERAMGSKHFLAMYLLSGLLGGLGWLWLSPNPYAVCVGASGAIFGVWAVDRRGLRSIKPAVAILTGAGRGLGAAFTGCAPAACVTTLATLSKPCSRATCTAARVMLRPWIAAYRLSKSPPLSSAEKSAHLPSTRLTLHDRPLPPARLPHTHSCPIFCPPLSHNGTRLPALASSASARARKLIGGKPPAGWLLLTIAPRRAARRTNG